MFRGFSIDPEGTLVVDDAIWVDETDLGWVLRVAFARVPSDGPDPTYLSRADALRMSLDDSGVKDVCVVGLALDGRFAPGPTSFEAAAFENVGRMTVGEAEGALASEGHPMRRQLALLVRVATGLRNRRTDVNAPPVAIPQAVEEAMVAVNAALADACVGSGLDVVWRNQAAYRSRRTSEVVVGRATYSVEREGHWPLQLPAYAHFTSPLRRRCDVVNQLLLTEALAGRPNPFGSDRLSRIAMEMNLREGRRGTSAPAGHDRMRLEDASAQTADALYGAGGKIPPTVALRYRREPLVAAAVVAEARRDPVFMENVTMLMRRDRRWVTSLQRDVTVHRTEVRQGARALIEDLSDGVVHFSDWTWAAGAKAAAKDARHAAFAVAMGVEPAPGIPIDAPDPDVDFKAVKAACESLEWAPASVKSARFGGTPSAPLWRAVASAKGEGVSISSGDAYADTKDGAKRNAFTALADRMVEYLEGIVPPEHRGT